MRRFRFQLKLPTGQTVTEEAIAERWQWTHAFSEACRRAEHRFGILAGSGVTCVAYDSEAVMAPEPSVPTDATMPLAA